LRSPSPLTVVFKSRAMCTFEFMCKHAQLKHALFLELWVLQRLKQYQ